ncbi:putative toxin-antitoxin system toxin component, PIN family [Candidatus Thiosymbion oneisti]|uniref:putative toxin-antitoxin system toxin component, PIN family n=1 Tax=Candidatus Thiosymbion oneisti TaxID=589554 RepID=UPI00210AB528|nr:putative toxin-antitoxin system toxin component, PIN family [Candidatus Thiosymbion oneisti]
MIQRPKFALPKVTMTWWIELLTADTRVIQPTITLDFPRDLDDAPFLICAASGKADYLITGDRDFTEAQALLQTRIVSVRQFAETIAPQTLTRE